MCGQTLFSNTHNDRPIFIYGESDYTMKSCRILSVRIYIISTINVTVGDILVIPTKVPKMDSDIIIMFTKCCLK